MLFRSIAPELLKKADMAMYRAKAAGGANFQFYEAGMHLSASRTLQLTTSGSCRICASASADLVRAVSEPMHMVERLAVHLVAVFPRRIGDDRAVLHGDRFQTMFQPAEVTVWAMLLTFAACENRVPPPGGDAFTVKAYLLDYKASQRNNLTLVDSQS